MKLSIGNDIVYLPEFKLSCTKAFIQKVYTKREIQDCQDFHDPLVRFGSTWAAKEACYKAIKQIFPDIKFWWKSLEIMRNKEENQIPRLRFLKAPTFLNTSLTISHDGNYCWAVCLVLVR